MMGLDMLNFMPCFTGQRFLNQFYNFYPPTPHPPPLKLPLNSKKEPVGKSPFKTLHGFFFHSIQPSFLHFFGLCTLYPLCRSTTISVVELQ